MSDYAPFSVLETETLFTVNINSYDYLVLGLSNGTMLVFNIYKSIIGLKDALRLQISRHVGSLQDVVQIKE